MTNSAFGVEHFLVSKAMSGKKFKALLATKNRGSGRAQAYAKNRLEVHRAGPRGDVRSQKSNIENATRTNDNVRFANRKGII